MKYFKYSQIVYLIASLVFASFAIKDFIEGNQDYKLKAIITLGFMVMFFVRKRFYDKMKAKQNNQ